MSGSLTAMSVDEFLARLGSGEPTPGGGAAAALVGAAAAALVCMVCNLTVGRPKFAAVEDQVRALLAAGESVRVRLTRAVDEDALAYDAVIQATRLPKDDASLAESRTAAVQAALKGATRPPLATAADAALVLELCSTAVELVNPRVISDISVAASLAAAALESAADNVEVNLSAIHDSVFVADMRQQLASIVDQHRSMAGTVHQRARERAA